MKNLDITDPTFTQDVEGSQQYVWMAAQWLSGMGVNVFYEMKGG